MIKYHRTLNDTVIAELIDDNYIITLSQDVLDIFGDLVSSGCNRIIIHDRNLHSDFFHLNFWCQPVKLKHPIKIDRYTVLNSIYN